MAPILGRNGRFFGQFLGRAACCLLSRSPPPLLQFGRKDQAPKPRPSNLLGIEARRFGNMHTSCPKMAIYGPPFDGLYCTCPTILAIPGQCESRKNYWQWIFLLYQYSMSFPRAPFRFTLSNSLLGGGARSVQNITSPNISPGKEAPFSLPLSSSMAASSRHKIILPLLLLAARKICAKDDCALFLSKKGWMED